MARGHHSVVRPARGVMWGSTAQQRAIDDEVFTSSTLEEAAGEGMLASEVVRATATDDVEGGNGSQVSEGAPGPAS
jgi:hypothetical protein